MNHKVRAQDIKKGDHLFVCEWLDEESKDVRDEYFGGFLFANARVAKPIGDPFKVLAIAFPFITVEMCANGARGTMDTRKAVFISVDEEYVASLHPQYGKKPKKSEGIPLLGGNTKHRYNQTTRRWETIIEET